MSFGVVMDSVLARMRTGRPQALNVMRQLAGVAMVVRRDNSSSRTATDDDIELVRSARSSLSSEDDRDPEEGSGR